MVQDPNFWRRFSVAVHNDELEKSLEAQSTASSLKQAYVTTTSVNSTAPSSPFSPSSHSSQAPLHLVISAAPTHPPPPAYSPTNPHPNPHPRSPSISFGPTKPHTFPSQPCTPTTPRHPTLPLPPRAASSPRSQRVSQRISGFTRHLNASTLSLGGLTGRSRDQFRFCTTITADPSCSESWLESQRKKARHRTWMCWAFWLALAAVVAGVVVAVLLLKAKGII